MTETDSTAARTVPPPEPDAPPHPPGDYAIVEIMGHQTLVGRIAEVTRFGAAMLQIEPIFAGELLQPVLQGGPSIYRLTPCSAETAFARAPKETQRWALPDAIKATLPPAPPPEALTLRADFARDAAFDDADEDDADDDGFGDFGAAP